MYYLLFYIVLIEQKQCLAVLNSLEAVSSVSSKNIRKHTVAFLNIIFTLSLYIPIFKLIQTINVLNIFFINIV